MIEVLGDAARGEEFALVRLRVDGDRIVDADADGIERPLRGLTLLEGAAVGGETLAVDALANALGRVFRAAPSSWQMSEPLGEWMDARIDNGSVPMPKKISLVCCAKNPEPACRYLV